ncbi:MAG: hypothetical protein HY951_10320 [Bacteroidia bacterium]|nr:hypothetical protein [Bacteroidia bacterium]
MKKIIFALLVLTTAYLSSCQKDEDPTNNPSSIEGTWKCVENSATYGAQNYYVDISKDTTSSNKIIIDNFFGLGLGKTVPASQSGQSLTISNAVQQGTIFNGTGTIASNNNSISWTYTVDEGNGPENVTATYTKM